MASVFNILLSLILMLLLTTLAPEAASTRDLNDDLMAQMFEKWKAKYCREYGNGNEQARRFEIFKSNVEFIESFNKQGNHTYELGINGFADLTHEEFMARYSGYKPAEKRSGSARTAFRYANVASVPPAIDWRTKGAVTKMKDQLSCGSCWAFSAVGALEGIHQITTGKLITLSEQELLDCDTLDSGCSGGYMDRAFAYLAQKGGIASESNYPYIGTNNTCDTKKAERIAARIKGHELVTLNNETALLNAVAHQPVSVAIEGSGGFMFYKKGIFEGPCGTDLDHGVVTIGYGVSKKGIKYWILKNSWGLDWGNKGYGLLRRDIDAKEGLCGIAKEPTYPIV